MTLFALVHGGGDSASSFDLLAAELRERGHDVAAVDLPTEDPSSGLWDYARTMADAIGDRDDVVVVGHSLGGFTAPLVCALKPVDLLVLVAGMVPSPGETVADWWSNTGHDQVPGGDGDEIATFMHDVPPEVAAESLAAGRDQTEGAMQEPWPLDAWPDVPTRYLLCRDDRFFPADWSRGVVRERLGITPDEIDGSHCVYLSRPGELAERLVAYAA